MKRRTKEPLAAVFAAVFLGTVSVGCRGDRHPETGADVSHEQAASPNEHEGDAHASGDDHGPPDRVRLTSAAISEASIGTWTVSPVSLEHLLVLNGSVGYDEDRLLHVGANVRGRVASIPVDLGDDVREGGVLLEIESVELGRAREALVRELSELRVARRAYERARALVDAQAISQGEFQAREGAFLTRRAAAEAAERTLHLFGETQAEIDRLRARVESDDPFHTPEDGGLLALRAPFAGTVVERKVTPGTLFEALQPLLTLADLDEVWVFLEVYEKDLSLLRRGVSVTIRTEAWPQETFRGAVDFIGSVVERDTRTVRVRATVPNPDRKLRPGMFVKGQVDVPQSYEGRTVLAVPQSALQTLGGRTTVFVQEEPGVFGRRAVETGHSFEGFTEIYSGIEEGDVVVAEGSFVLKSEFARANLVHEH
jgi:cobalt-zinc-cadmium efflux system membrane fusion protein